MVKIPEGSIYFWMYEQGLKHVELSDIEIACAKAGVRIRPKDEENYWNGYYRSDLYMGRGKEDIFMLTHAIQREPNVSQEFFSTSYNDYPYHPYVGQPEIQNRWVPCSKDNKPMIKWGNGCMTLADAVAYKSQRYLAENLKGTKLLVIDCDGNHDGLDLETIYFLNRWRGNTHCIEKPEYHEGMPVSFHLTFYTARIIPTMHFPYAHIDIIGNRRNSLRYWKNKKWNHIEPQHMTPKLWKELQDYIAYRKDKANER